MKMLNSTKKINNFSNFSDIFNHPNLFSKIDKFVQSNSSEFSLITPYESTPFITALISRHYSEDIILLTDSSQKARLLFEDLELFIENSAKIYFLPEIETHPLGGIETGLTSTVERNGVLSKIIDNKSKKIIIASGLSISQKIPELTYLQGDGKISFETGQVVNLSDVSRKLSMLGYERSYVVEEPGEFCVRGNLIDVFPGGFEKPLRIDFFGDEIEKLRIFETDTQLSLKLIEKAEVRMVRNLSKPKDEEEPAFQGSVMDLINKNSILMLDNPSKIKNSIQEYTERLLLNKEFNTSKLIFNFEEISPRFKKIPKTINISNLKLGYKTNSNDCLFKSFDVRKNQDLSVLDPVAGALNIIDKNSLISTILIASTNVERLKKRIKEDSKWSHLLKRNIFFQNQSYNYNFGLELDPNFKLIVLGDKELFGVVGKNRRLGREIKRSKKIEMIKSGNLVIHEDHGLAKFIGVTNLKGYGDREYLELHFAEQDKLFVPADQISRINIFKGGEENSPKLNRLHGKEWERQKNKVQKSTEILASQLLYLHSKRKVSEGISFKKNNDWQLALESSFPFEETVDQKRSMDEIYKDMESNIPMDRLLCGDVGFGKTELAIRACFKAVQSGKQAVVLVPTTILAEQHFETFKARLSPFPVNIECFTRSKTQAESLKVRSELKSGSIDICIGTHKILQRDIEYKDLGLFIIDEEHKFGVKHKELLKQLRLNLDILSLSATPIPRTMNLALSGVRDLSLLETPPSDRHSVKTYAVEESEDLIKEIILKEKDRGGQVFIVFNRVNKIDNLTSRLKKLIPEVSIDFAHGQMKIKELTKVINNFTNKSFDVLISTTIIESGLDMPDVNTILILNPHQMGLAQLYQLRGRVGRSQIQAYAYFMIPNKSKLTDDTEKRLDAIIRFQHLGAGSDIAAKDMEIRGVGNVLGKEQSGNVNSVGLGLYMKFLTTAVEKRKNDKYLVEDWGKRFEISIELNQEIGVPQNFIPDIESRLQIYYELSSILEVKKMDDYKKDMQDRFGELPLEVINLVNYQKMKILCFKSNIISVKRGNDYCLFTFEVSIRSITNFLTNIFPQGTIFTDKKVRVIKELNPFDINILIQKIVELKDQFQN